MPAVLHRRRLVVLAVVLAPMPALAAPLVPGDGSWASNQQIFSPVPMAEEAHWVPAPLEDDTPFFDTDWSLGSKASFIRDNSGDRYQVTFSPSVTLTHVRRDAVFSGTASAALTKRQDDGPVNLDQLLLSGTSSYEITALSKLDSHLSFSMTQEDPHAPDVASDIATTPVEYSGAADSTYTRKFGRLNVSLTANAGRDVYGTSTLADGTSVDNTSQNNTRLGGGLRLGYEVTPVLEPFVDTAVQRTLFDASAPGLSTKLDGNLYTVKAGVSAKWTRFSASASVGEGLERFDDPNLADVTATLYDASLAYQPTEALALTASFSTTIGAPGPNGGGTARIGYQASAGAAYRVNDWLGWRLSAGWHDVRYAGTGNTDRGYDLGVGADYLVNDHASLSADYGFDHSEVSPNPGEDTHTVSVGLTVHK